MRIDRVSLNTAPHMDSGVVLAPLRFDRIVFNLRRGDRIGSYRDGIDCASSAGNGDGIWWNRGRLMSDDVEWSDLVFRQMTASGYTVIGDPEDLFPEAERRRAAYEVRAAVEEIRMNLCEVVDVLSRTPLGVQYGKASLRVYWQVYAPILRKVVLEARTAGYHEETRPQPDAHRVLVSGAFAQAAANFAADPALVALVQQPRPTRKQILRVRTNRYRWLPYIPPYETLFVDHAEDIRYAVVLIDTGEGFGSGLFIAPHLILTNQHVVDGSPRVRVRLVTGRETIGDVVAYHDQRDVALIQVEPAGYQALPLRSDPVRIGEDVYAIGNPLKQGLRATVSKGVVSRFGQNRFGFSAIQADVSVHGGNSGGPLLDSQGNVVGITYAGYTDPGETTSIGLNYFIPIGDALKALDLKIRHPNDTRVSEGEE